MTKFANTIFARTVKQELNTLAETAGKTKKALGNGLDKQFDKLSARASQLTGAPRQSLQALRGKVASMGQNVEGTGEPATKFGNTIFAATIKQELNTLAETAGKTKRALGNELDKQFDKLSAQASQVSEASRQSLQAMKGKATAMGQRVEDASNTLARMRDKLQAKVQPSKSGPPPSDVQVALKTLLLPKDTLSEASIADRLPTLEGRRQLLGEVAKLRENLASAGRQLKDGTFNPHSPSGQAIENAVVRLSIFANDMEARVKTLQDAWIPDDLRLKSLTALGLESSMTIGHVSQNANTPDGVAAMKSEVANFRSSVERANRRMKLKVHPDKVNGDTRKSSAEFERTHQGSLDEKNAALDEATSYMKRMAAGLEAYLDLTPQQRAAASQAQQHKYAPHQP